MIVLGVDPGESAGWAILGPGPTLLACGLGDPVRLDWNEHPRPDRVIVEMPEVYPGSKVNPNDLIKLAAKAGAVLGRYYLLPCQTVAPKTWKGQLPKPAKASDPYIVAERIKRKLDCAKVEALGLPPSLKHNVYDAVGLALYAIGISIR